MSHMGLTLCVLGYCLLSTISLADTENRALSRKKRYVVFPEGSSFSIALCATLHTLTNDSIFTEGLNWGISYDLPNETKPELEPFLQLRKDQVKPISTKYQYPTKLNHGIRNEIPLRYNDWDKATSNHYYNPAGGKKYYYRKSDYDYVKRRHRRELYNKLEVIMNAMGFNGRACILQALCEASQRLMPKGNTLVEEMIKIAFSLPLKRMLLPHEPEEHHTYTKAHRAGHEGARCAAMFVGCPFSLVDMALGKYSGESNYGTTETEDPESAPDIDRDVADSSMSHFTMK